MMFEKSKKILSNNNGTSNISSNETICIDMHCHSTFSDGTQMPEQLAEKLFAAGVKYAALTDHNTLDGLQSFKRALMQYGIGHVSGVEITTKHNYNVVHLLAYGFDQNDKELNNLLNEKTNHIASAGNPTAHIYKTAPEVIEIVHNAGGIVVLAHPYQTLLEYEKIKKIANSLKMNGLDGIEAIYNTNSPEMEGELIEIAKEAKLFISAGSDYHSVNGVDLGKTISMIQWRSFRDALLDRYTDYEQSEEALNPQSSGKKTPHWRSFILNILLPAFLSLALFTIALFVFVVPYFEKTLLERKRENIRQLTQVAWGVLDEAAMEVEDGQLSLEQAQNLAKDRIKAMRYGKDNNDYFWIQDTSPKILMHPYRTDLNNQDVSDFKDAQGTRIFVAFSDLVLEKGEGYISYVWQWMDDTERLEPKESYIRLFEPWGWVIGTGIYVNDVKIEIAKLKNNIVIISGSVIFVVMLMLLYMIRQGVKLEKSRIEAESLLIESTERYRALSEAATEGVLFIYDGRCRYANTVMYGLLGCPADKIELLVLQDVFPDVKANEKWLQMLADNTDNVDPTMMTGVIKRSNGILLSCNMSVRNGMNDPNTGYMILVRRSVDLTEYTGSHVALNRLLHVPNSVASDLADSIKNSYQINEVAALCKKTSGLVVSLLENGTSSIAIAHMISIISDIVTQKIIELTFIEIGPPPVPYTFLALGSHGRHSQTLFSDQDNALIYNLTGEEDEHKVRSYFLKMGNMVCDGLEQAGYHKCIGLKMASNPQWCQPLYVWKSYFNDWIRNPEPQQVVEFSILFDFRAVSGDPKLASDLRDYIYSEIGNTPFFLSQIAQNALIFKTPLRLFGNIMTSGDKDHPGRIDVKTPAMAIVCFARLYALKQNIPETNTLLQLDAIKRLGIILDSKHRDIITSYETLMRLRLWNQAIAFENNQQLDNWIDPDQLGDLEEVVLRECFNAIDDFQGLIQREFLS
jgi:CBS domain-containing protein